MRTNLSGVRIGAAAALWVAVTSGALLAEHRPRVLEVRAGDVAFTVVGQVTNSPPDQSSQYGYIPTIAGLMDLFSSPTQDETTALFTFFTQATTKALRRDGTQTIVEREGTTTVYYNVAPHGNFGDPASFQDGEAILVMDLKQQVIVDTVTSAFTVVNVNDVVSASAFEKDGTALLLARKHAQFRTSLAGHLNTTSPPSGYFAGYAVATGPGLFLPRMEVKR
jgi:hypothetical protein